MPSTEGMEVLVRRTQPSDEEWLGLIMARRELIKPHLDSLSLLELSSLECMRFETNWTHRLDLDQPTCSGDERFSLKTQGLFHPQLWSAEERGPTKGTMRVWGLIRAGLWVLVTIGYVHELGYRGRGYDRAKTVEIAEADLPIIIATIKESPKRIWERLGEDIKGFARQRLVLYNQVLNLSRMVEVEELAYSLIPSEV